jgi:LysR family transcriptional regulator, nitrogen assimilation regulatory protein
MLAFSLHRPTTLAMRELARRVRVELTKAVADGRMVGRMDQPQIWNQTDGAG